MLIFLKKTASHFLSRAKLWIFFSLSKIYKRKWTWFEDDIYKGKRVIVIGPANSSLSYLPGSEIDSFDIVVRINKSPLTVSGKERAIGSRTDILYHCCDEDPIKGGGPIKSEILSKQKIFKIIYTYAEKGILHNFYRTIYKYPKLEFCRTPPLQYRNLKREYKAKMPTTGLQALNHLLSCNFSELHITGFTFFRSPYADGYRDQYKSAEQASRLAMSSGNHDPDEELRVFKKEYEKVKNHKVIKLDSELETILLNS